MGENRRRMTVQMEPVNDFVWHIENAEKKKGFERSFQIMKAKEIMAIMNEQELEDLLNRIKPMTNKQKRILIAVGIPKIIHSRAMEIIVNSTTD